jgi:hypothetical protein
MRRLAIAIFEPQARGSELTLGIWSRRFHENLR